MATSRDQFLDQAEVEEEGEVERLDALRTHPPLSNGSHKLLGSSSPKPVVPIPSTGVVGTSAPCRISPAQSSPY